MDHNCPPPYNILEIVAIRDQKSMVTYVIKVTEWNFEVRSDLQGCLEAAMASEATKMAVKSNMHMETRVIKIADFKSEVIRPMRPFRSHHGLKGYQNGCFRQYAYGCKCNQGC